MSEHGGSTSPPPQFGHIDVYSSDDDATSAYVASRSYAVVHETTYRYEHPVSLASDRPHGAAGAPVPGLPVAQAHGVARGGDPRGDGGRLRELDHVLFIEAEHAELSVSSSMWVDLTARDYPHDDDTPPWEEVRARLAYKAGRAPHASDSEATRYLFESARVRNKRELAAWTLASFPPGRPVLAGVRALMMRIHEELTFDPKATTVSTPVMTVFEMKRGVCQDFAHLMLSCLRNIGLCGPVRERIPAHAPAPGVERLVGADASHAWISVYVPDAAGGVWVDADHRTACSRTLQHITVGSGRDDQDVIPLRGVLLGGGEHELDIAVTVAPAADYDRLFPGREP